MKFKKEHTKVPALLNSGSEVNAITQAYTAKLRLRVCLTNGEIQKINEFTFLIYDMVLAKFQLEHKQEKMQVLQETFLMPNTLIKLVLRILFLSLSKIKINFADQELNWKTYTPDETLPTTK